MSSTAGYINFFANFIVQLGLRAVLIAFITRLCLIKVKLYSPGAVADYGSSSNFELLRGYLQAV